MVTALIQITWGALLCFYNERILEASAHTLEDIHDKLHEAIRAKTEFLARCSHELRTPLNGILGPLEILMDTKLDEEQKNYLKICQECSLNLKNLINGMFQRILN